MTSPNFPLSRLALYFAGLLVLGIAFAMAVIWAIETYMQIAFDNNAMGVILPIIIAMPVGQIYFNRTGHMPSSGYAWKAGLVFATISTAMSLAIAFGLHSAGLLPQLDGLFTDPNGGMIFAGVMAGVWLLLILACRFAFSSGAKQALKLRDKVAKRDASRG